MRTPDTIRYHGVVFSTLINEISGDIAVERLKRPVRGFYLLNGELPIYIKFTKNRVGPWHFNFQSNHQHEYRKTVLAYGECLLVFVCGFDGVVAINRRDAAVLMDDVIEEQEVISVKRRLRRQYSISSRDGRLDRKVSRNSFIELVNTWRETIIL